MQIQLRCSHLTVRKGFVMKREAAFGGRIDHPSPIHYPYRQQSREFPIFELFRIFIFFGT